MLRRCVPRRFLLSCAALLGEHSTSGRYAISVLLYSGHRRHGCAIQPAVVVPIEMLNTTNAIHVPLSIPSIPRYRKPFSGGMVRVHFMADEHGKIHWTYVQVAMRCRPYSIDDKLGVQMVQNGDEEGEVNLLNSDYTTNRFAFTYAWWSAYGFDRHIQSNHVSRAERNRPGPRASRVVQNNIAQRKEGKGKARPRAD